MISICLTTRERPEAFLEMCKSALHTSDNPSDIEFVSYHDRDDPSEYTYVGNHTEIIGNTKTISQMMNSCYKFARGDIYMYIADDFLFLTNGWDTEVKKIIDSHKDGIVLVVPSMKDYQRWGFASVAFMHRNWIKATGMFLPTMLGEGLDKWIDSAAMEIGRRVEMKDVRIIHNDIHDEIHKKKNSLARRNKWKRKYDFPETVKARQKYIKNLRDYIEKHNSSLLHKQP